MNLFRESLRKRIRKGVPLKDLTTFHIGGAAESFLEVRTEAELEDAIRIAWEDGVPWFLLGGGSNLVVSDAGVDGLVIRNRASDRVEADLESGIITVSSGLSLGRVVEFARSQNLSGLEPFTGIPGSIGGAIFGNAGAYGRCLADLLVKAVVLDPKGIVREVDPAFFGFSYRHSSLKENRHVVLNVSLKTVPGSQENIASAMEEILRQRRSKHPPLEVGSAGSFFRNLPPSTGETRRRAAGEVLEKAGAKELAVGGASVYRNHANFIVNYGKATAEDVRKLAALMKDKVLKMFGIELSEEVIYVGRY